jgi:phosphatidylglycerophosphatase A
MGNPDAAPTAGAVSTREKKPRFALFVATAGGLGYLPKAPGTWGSLLGVLIYALTQYYFPLTDASNPRPQVVALGIRLIWAAETSLLVALVIAAIGVWASDRVAAFLQKKDPQVVVVDEVSGQHLTYLLSMVPLNWKYLLAGFILFRAFDIWKPFPARQAESLPGGWGIMADDWIAGIYAAVVLHLLRRAGI